ncbi:outer membrane beta-barrel protein [Puniceicoccus vermicola]|uniref:Outer membrane beta-barrel protein n=1 Tax=Puniceicoccus vermicola TaxID=388746 RepID=A0A7X1E5B1_9BACT|nr:outer membrane beta-barrel protein [Puniceicoccus vermicola]MBC2601417.1 outer membrane beta-barrel protein [Puniceicoccus vermicola]
MKIPLLATFSVLSASSALYASPLLSVGDHADLYAQVSGSVAYTDNLTLDENNTLDDVRFIVTPGAVLEVGRGLTNLNGSLSVNYGFVRYADNTVFDTELWNVVGNLDFNGPRYTAGVNGGYVEKQQNESDVNADKTLILQKTGFAGGNIRYRISEKFSLGAKGRFDNITYDGGNNVDRDIYSVPVDVYYEVTPLLDATAGLRYRQTDVQNGQDYDDYFYNVGLTGEVTEKLTTTFKVGYQTRDLTGGGSNEGTITLNSATTYDATERGSLRLFLNRDFVTGGAGSSIERTGVRASYIYIISPRLTADVTGSYDFNDYQDSSREDNTYLARVGASYRFNSLWSVNSFYTFRDNDSNFDGASYTENMVQVGANFRY